MKAEFEESYDLLDSMNLGDVAVSRDRKKVFYRTRGHIITDDGEIGDEVDVVIDLNDYWMSHIPEGKNPVRKLQKGDKFTFTV